MFKLYYRGAEGTVIEEQSTVPGLIWGMSGDGRLMAEQSSETSQGDLEYGSITHVPIRTKHEEEAQCHSASQAHLAKGKSSFLIVM